MILFDPQPPRESLPARLQSPFNPAPPHALAQRAADLLRQDLLRGHPLPRAAFEGAHRGTMFGVLVVSDAAERVGHLRGFAGTIGGQWHVEGFVGPLFDVHARAAFWPAGEAELEALDRQIRALDPPLAAEKENLRALGERHAQARAHLLSEHEARRALRHERRSAIVNPLELQTLAEESRADGRAERDLRAAQRAERDAGEEKQRTLAAQRAALVATQTERSCALLEQIFSGYDIPNARGHRRSVRALFAPATPPGGAGDCAAPKLFAHAARHGLRPLALAEFWWGTPAATGGRQEGIYYPSCRGKCGPVLAHMLDGWDVEPAPVFGSDQIAAGQPLTLFEDEWVVVVDKPAGLLSVPGRGGALRDSVQTRLRARHPNATGPLVVHRLDLDTSGVLLAAKDAATHAALQKQFISREIEKRYVAWVDGLCPGDHGRIDLAMRMDPDDRPRQVCDPKTGKDAVTEWTVDRREGNRTRVVLRPRTGRTHQLRVHAAHPLGLCAPIVGDRLYGRASAERLLLHAEALAFIHPHTGARVNVTSAAPF